MRELRVATWNLFWCLGYPKNEWSRASKAVRYFRHREDRTEVMRIADALRGLRLDILGVQEIDGGSRRNGGFDQREHVRRSLVMRHVSYAPDRSWFGYCDDGNAIISKRPPLRTARIPLPYRIERRNAIVNTIRHDGKEIDVYVTHFGAHRTNKSERCAQAKAIHDRITSAKRPAILIGDLNCEPGSEEYRVLCGTGTLYGRAHAPTYPAFRPTKRYDHILCTPDLSIIECRTINTEHSDHLPVFARIVRAR